VILPHIGSATEGARVGMIGLAADNVVAFLEGRPLLTPVAGSPQP
jgi:lactate dehydrogenase-like 2-hydroxyacid dehydrogenase